MISIVGGFVRSGTSMMMEALIAGGMEADWSSDRDKITQQHADKDYNPNRKGLFEISFREYGDVDFPRKHEDKLIKVMLGGLDNLAVDSYQIVLMRRDPEEIRQSFEAFFGQPFHHPWLKEYHARIHRAAQMLQNRRDVESLLVLDYRRVVNNPRAAFAELADYGWEFDQEKAVATINPELCRFKREKLVAGL